MGILDNKCTDDIDYRSTPGRYNQLYDVKVLEKNIQDRIIKNYEIEAKRATLGHVADNCFWVRQAVAGITMEALPWAKYFNSEMYDSLKSLYLKLSV